MGFFSAYSPADMGKMHFLVSLISQSLSSFSGIIFPHYKWKQTAATGYLGREKVIPKDTITSLWGSQLFSLLSSFLGAVLKRWCQGLNSHHAELSSAWDLFVVFVNQAARCKSASKDIAERSGSLPNSLDDSLFPAPTILILCLFGFCFFFFEGVQLISF